MKEHNVIEVGAFEAKNRLSALVEMASRGKRIWITKHGHRMALLSSGLEPVVGDDGDLRGKFRALRASSTSGSGGSLKELVEEGRR